MKLENMESIEAARVMDSDGNQFLRLNRGQGGAWYAPTAFGFILLGDRQADELEAEYQKGLQL